MHITARLVFRLLLLSILLLPRGVSVAQVRIDEWISLGPPGATVRALAVDPSNPNTLYTGSEGGGLFKSTNGGASWGTNTIPVDGISTLTIDRSNTNIIYAGADVEGVLKSTDGGDNWFAVNNGIIFTNGFEIKTIVIDPSNTSTVYAGINTSGVFKSTNGGASWDRIRAGLIDLNARGLVIDPSNTNIVYFGSSSVVYVSLNGGQSWSQNSVRLEIIKLAINPLNPRLIYAGTTGRGVFQRQVNTVEILSASLDTPKKLTISGRNFMPPARVIINNSDRTGFITEASNTIIKLKGKAKKLGLRPGDNSIQVIDSTGAASNVFILRR